MPFLVRVNPYNQLETLAWYHLQAAQAKVDLAEHRGLALDCMSCLIALAFSVEALLNFVGNKKVPDWKERAPFNTKLKLLETKLSLKLDRGAEPYLTMKRLKDARDKMAHGQPLEFTVNTEDRNELAHAMQSSWSDSTNEEFLTHAYEQIQDFKRTLLSKARIKPGATYTTAIGGAR